MPPPLEASHTFSFHSPTMPSRLSAASFRKQEIGSHETFSSTVVQIEGQKISAVQVYVALKNLMNKLSARKENVFLPQKVRECLSALEDDGLVNVTDFKNAIVEYYTVSIRYLEQWSANFDNMKMFEWLTLESVPTWGNVQPCYEWFAENVSGASINDSQLFDEVVSVISYASEEQVQKWNEAKSDVDLRWVEVFKLFTERHIPCENILKLVEFGLSLPGTNAPTERVFSLVNDIWSSDKTQLNVDTLKCMVTLKTNVDADCVEYYNHLLTQDRVLRAIHSSAKYKSKH